MYSSDNSNNCRIFDNSFYQDLKEYSIYPLSSTDDLVIHYKGFDRKNITMKLDKLSKYIDHNVEENIWTPAFIDDSDSSVQYKPIYGKQQIRNSILGIEEFVSFPAIFENWDFTSIQDGGPVFSGIMASNWYISTMFNTIEPAYGILFWYKKNGPSSSMDDYTEQPVPTPTPTPTPTPQDVLGYKIKTGISITTSVPDPKYPDDPDKAKKSTAYYDLWISDGECFSYFDGPIDRSRSRAKLENSKTYLSPGLMPIYREIYHRLTLKNNRSITSGLNKKQGLALQKICYMLSSSPLHDRTTIDILNDSDIYNLVTSYVNTTNIQGSLEEKNWIKNICKLIFTKYKNLSISISKNHLRNNYIQDKETLCKKIISKYIPALSIKSDLAIKYKKSLTNGPHAILNLSSISLYDKDISSTGVIYNNSSIKIGNINYKTNMSATESDISIYADNFNNQPKIYLADNSLPPITDDIFYLGAGLNITDYINGQEYRIKASSISNIVAGDAGEYSYIWEKTSGPNCLKFTDYNKDRFRVQRYYSSTDSSPDIYIRQSGTYEIKATRFKAGGVIQSDVCKITFNNSEPLDAPLTLPTIATNNKVTLGVFKQLAFNKYGLLWILDSDNYYDNGDYNFQDDYGIGGIVKLRDVQLNFNTNTDSVAVMPSYADLTLKFYPNNTKILLLGIQIENMRDHDSKYKNCKSFYEEKIIRTKQPASIEEQLGGADFVRRYTGSTNFYSYVNGVKTNTYATYSTPTVSTVVAPRISAYGGYDDKTIETIGISMPYHPKGTMNELPILSSRNDLTSTTGIYCHLKEVLPTGDKHYVTFKQGHFHPLSGWLSATNFPSMTGNSVVIENNFDKQQSIVFKGPGILNIGPSLDGKASVYRSAITITGRTSSIYQNPDQRGFSSINRDRPGANIGIEDIGLSDGWENVFDASTACQLPTQTYGISSDKTIKDIEVKLNFLNYPNPKNLLVWLEVNSPVLTGLPTTNKSFIANSTNSSVLNNYTSNIGNNYSKLYLLNQEHISNYSVNFSLTFSDNANKYCNTSHYNNNVCSIAPKQKILKNNGMIRPTLHASGYNDILSESYKSALVNNSINDMVNTFSKYNGIPITGTTFTLNIAVVDAINYELSILDNLVINNNMAGLTSTEHRQSSNTISNSLCSWELIAHTSDIKYPVAEDALGYIDYYTPNSGLSYVPYTGYREFIGDFSNKEFLIPNVNINAPYGYLANISECFYADPNVPRTPASQLRKFQEFLALLPYLMIGIGFSFGIAVGGLVSVALADALYGNGGRNDPIVNYLIDRKMFIQTQNINAQYYKPVYSQEPYGDANKAILCASNDGAIWFYFDAPIFRYTNTPMMRKNKYGYIKLYKDSFPALSNYPYQIVRSWEDLKLSPITLSTDQNINISGSDTVYTKDSMVYVGNQTNASENGYYIVNNNNWTKAFVADDHRLMLHNIKASGITNNDIQNNKCILIPGTRAYYSFDKGENVYISSMGTSMAITNTMLLSTYEGQKTLLFFPSGISTTGYIAKPDANSSNILALYDKYRATKDPVYLPINQWAFNKSTNDAIPVTDPESRPSAYGEGSVGWGTDGLKPDMLFSMGSLYNKILDTTDIADSHLNDRYKYNDLMIADTNGNNTSFISFSSGDSISDLLTARSYTRADMGYIFENNTGKLDDDISVNIFKKKLRTTSMADNSNEVYVELKSNKFKTLNIASGEIHIQNDYSFYHPIGISSNDFTIATDRLSYLVNTAIPSGMEEYNGLAEDPTGCYVEVPRLTAAELLLPITSGTCPKIRVKQKLHNWIYEKNQLQNMLEIASTGIDTPHTKINITVNSIDNSLSIKSTNNSSLYWIQINPEQYCNVAYEETVKIFEKLEWKILPIAGNYRPNSQITPIDIKHPPNSLTSDENMTIEGDKIIYKVTRGKILEKIREYAAKYPNISWNDHPAVNTGDAYQRITYGSLSEEAVDTKKLLIGIGDSPNDVLITYLETYIVPSGLNSKRNKKLKEVLNLDSDLKIKFRNIPRKIKGTDCFSFTKYSYDSRGHLVKTVNPASSVEKISNNFVCWHCIDPDGNYTRPSDNLIIQNEMFYRAFYGSIDGIENKNTYLSDSKEAWEWIPYEYYNKPPPTPSPTPTPSITPPSS